MSMAVRRSLSARGVISDLTYVASALGAHIATKLDTFGSDERKLR